MVASSCFSVLRNTAAADTCCCLGLPGSGGDRLVTIPRHLAGLQTALIPPTHSTSISQHLLDYNDYLLSLMILYPFIIVSMYPWSTYCSILILFSLLMAVYIIAQHTQTYHFYPKNSAECLSKLTIQLVLANPYLIVHRCVGYWCKQCTI